MKEPRWILPEAALAIHQILISDHGGLGGVRDQNLLDSALNRPNHIYSYRKSDSIPELAAAYCYGLGRNHPFIDGNKRTALTIAGVFLELNGFQLIAPEAEAVIIIEQLAAGSVNEPGLAAWFAENTTKMKA